MDEYIEPYADDPEIVKLRAKEAIIYECRKASAILDDDVAISTVLTAHPNADALFSIPELTEFIHSWRTPHGDIPGRHAVDCGLFTLELKIQERIGEICFEDLYRPLIDASPVKVDGLGRLDFLAALFPRGQSALMLDSSRASAGLPWTIEIGEDIGGAWFWPLSVLVEADEDDLIEKGKNMVAGWTSATANFNAESLDLMRDEIISRDIPVRLAMSTSAGTTLVFAIDAANEAEWRSKCRTLRARIKALGASCPPFRYDWVAPMIHSDFTRLVYFNPL